MVGTLENDSRPLIGSPDDPERAAVILFEGLAREDAGLGVVDWGVGLGDISSFKPHTTLFFKLLEDFAADIDVLALDLVQSLNDPSLLLISFFAHLNSQVPQFLLLILQFLTPLVLILDSQPQIFSRLLLLLPHSLDRSLPLLLDLVPLSLAGQCLLPISAECLVQALLGEHLLGLNLLDLLLHNIVASLLNLAPVLILERILSLCVLPIA